MEDSEGHEPASYDIIQVSEYYPENLYIIANKGLQELNNHSSSLLAFNLDEFVEGKNKKPKPLFDLMISNSEFTYSMLEYDKQYILFDTIIKGIYIFDIGTKTKLAVCDVERDGNPIKARSISQKMIKLKSGHVLRNAGGGKFGVVDIKGRKEKQYFINSQYPFYVKDNYLIGTNEFDEIVIYQYCD